MEHSLLSCLLIKKIEVSKKLLLNKVLKKKKNLFLKSTCIW